LKLNNYDIKRLIKLGLLIFAFSIGFFSLWYTNNLVNKLREQEREKIETWANATKLIASPAFEGDVSFLFEIIEANTTIPVIMTDENGVVTGLRNVDTTNTTRFSSTTEFLTSKIEDMKGDNEPIIIEYLQNQNLIIYYENSTLLKQLQIYPYFQLGIIAIFLAVSYFAFSYSRTSEQNKVWAGMSKETAHQLGTPISSLIGWMTYLKESDNPPQQRVIDEMQHDLSRLELITERFSKIGSTPVLEPQSVVDVVTESVNYINNRTSEKVKIAIQNNLNPSKELVEINKPLFAWVIENLCKNAVDAMKGEGSISFDIKDYADKVIIDVTDSGGGIPSSKHKTIFKPGYTTKRRGWGLGLSLVKRIIENYHQGKIFVKNSQLGQGTTFRIELKVFSKGRN
jgi:signal transduction histidine kinase